jgi:hypothetical protein
MGEFHAIHDYKTPKEMGKWGCGNPFISKINYRHFLGPNDTQEKLVYLVIKLCVSIFEKVKKNSIRGC